MAIEAVIFDIGNVLVEWHPERAFDDVIGEDRRRALFADVDLTAMNERVDLGEDMAQVVTQTARAHPAYHDDILLWHSRWAEMLTPDIPGSAILLRALRRRGVPVFALSNFGTSTLALADTMYPVLTEFDQRFVSGHMKVMKPDPAIYAEVERKLAHPPATLLFTDDRADNIAVAAGRGWQVHLFEGPEGLAQRLLAEGLLREGDISG